MSTREEKRKEIYTNMKKRGRIFRAHSKWGISYAHLYVSIQEAGYMDYDTIRKIMDGMINEGYIRPAKDVWGRTCGRNGNASCSGNYIIEKWVN